MSNKVKNNMHSSQMVKKFLLSTGFPFEMTVCRLLKNKGWETFPNETYLDLEHNKKREIDIIARKEIKDITVYLTIECKYSQVDSWIFISPQKKYPRYYCYIKRTPEGNYEDYDKYNKSFEHLSTLNSNEPTASNFISFDGNKKVDSNQTYESLYKVTKAMINLAAGVKSEYKRCIYFPMIIFSGPIFLARHLRKLSVIKANYVQFPFEFESSEYEEKKEQPAQGVPRFTLFDDLVVEWKKEKIDNIKYIYKLFGNKYLIEYISGSRLAWHLNRLEKEVGEINTSVWKVEQANKEEMLKKLKEIDDLLKRKT